MSGSAKPAMHQKHRPLAAMAFEETDMSIKGLKEALARKQAQQHPDGTAKDSTGTKIMPTAPVRVGGKKPQKKAAGRGR
jgi:hypothetical protein